jgi:hypothetical protein
MTPESAEIIVVVNCVLSLVPSFISASYTRLLELLLIRSGFCSCVISDVGYTY